MKNVTICLVFMLFTFNTFALADKNNHDFAQDTIFDEKTVLCEIDFRPDSYSLTVQAQKVLDGIVKQLDRVDTETKIIRIEGFIGEQDTAADKTQLSMQRVLAIETYLRINHSANFERFLTGHNILNSNCRAQITIYDNPWQGIIDLEQVTDRNLINGPS